MIITDFDLQMCSLRKDDPTWRTSLHADPTTDGLIVRIATKSGHFGYGYASATSHMGAIRTVMRAELEYFRKDIMGKDARNIGLILSDLDRSLRGASYSKASIDMALHDLNARALGVPVNTLLGGAVRESVSIIRIMAIKTPEEMARQAQKLVKEGYRYLKIKVSGEVEADVARFAAIREAVGAEPRSRLGY
jgi:L-alanine-DL-glutamate epimerase-like enolase superfamily enzyme